MEVALLSKHQTTTAGGGGVGGGGGGHENTEVPGCPEDRKLDGGRGGRGVVASRGWWGGGGGGAIRAGCLGEEAERTGKGTGRETI